VSPSWLAAALARHVRALILAIMLVMKLFRPDSLGDPNPLSRLSGINKPPTCDLLVPAWGLSEILECEQQLHKTQKHANIPLKRCINSRFTKINSPNCHQHDDQDGI
jgi:hypothetical protein